MTMTADEPIRGTAAADDAAGYLATVRRLAGAQKSAAPGAPAYSVLINRRLGRFVAAAAHQLRLTPNAVTAVSAALTFTGIGVLATLPPTVLTGVLVATLLALGYVFDSADGQLARLRGGGSLAGEWLDHVVDCLKTSSLHLAVLISAYRFFPIEAGALLLIPAGFAVVAAVAFFAAILNDQLKAVHRVRGGVAAQGRRSLPKSLLVLPTDYGVLCWAFVLLGAPPVFLTVYALLFAASLGHLALALPKWYRDMRTLDAARAG